MATKPNASEKIAELKQQIAQLQQEEVAELQARLEEARQVVAELEDELADLTGKPAASETRPRRTRRPSITDDALRPILLKAMADEGKMGLNAKELAAKVDQDPLRVRKFIKDNPKALKRQGSGPGTKFFLP